MAIMVVLLVGGVGVGRGGGGGVVDVAIAKQ